MSSELKKMNDALEMRLGEVVDLARKTWWRCAEVERDIEWTSEEERNVALLGAFTEIRQLCEFYKPKPDEKNKTVIKPIKWPEGFSVEVEKNGRKIVCVITEGGAYLNDENYPYRFSANVYDGYDLLFSINSCARGLFFQKKVLRSAMCAAIMVMSKARRLRANKRAKAAALKEAAAE